MLPNIQSLRAFAALNVLLMHVIMAGTSYALPAPLFQKIDGWGACGVDIFFVISGFVMYHSQIQRRRPSLEFMRDRVIRIVPLYWLHLVLIVGLCLAFPAAFNSLSAKPLHTLASFGFCSNFLMGSTPILYVGWTLEWEMFFYLLFAVALLIPKFSQGLVMLSLLLVAFCFSIGWMVGLEFLFGMAAAFLYHRGFAPPRLAPWLLAAGFAWLAASIFDGHLKMRGSERVFIWGIPSLLVVLGAAASRQLRSVPLAFLGDASYAIYLLHAFVIPPFYKLASRHVPGLDGHVLALFCFALSVTGGCLLHAYLEKPMTAALRRRFAPSAAKPA